MFQYFGKCEAYKIYIENFLYVILVIFRGKFNKTKKYAVAQNLSFRELRKLSEFFFSVNFARFGVHKTLKNIQRFIAFDLIFYLACIFLCFVNTKPCKIDAEKILRQFS